MLKFLTLLIFILSFKALPQDPDLEADHLNTQPLEKIKLHDDIDAKKASGQELSKEDLEYLKEREKVLSKFRNTNAQGNSAVANQTVEQVQKDMVISREETIKKIQNKQPIISEAIKSVEEAPELQKLSEIKIYSAEELNTMSDDELHNIYLKLNQGLELLTKNIDTITPDAKQKNLALAGQEDQMLKLVQVMAGEANIKDAVPAIVPKMPTNFNFKKGELESLMRTGLATIQSMKEKEAEEFLWNALKDKNTAHEFFKNHPKLFHCLLMLLRDKDALPHLTRILEQKQKMTMFAVFSVLTILFGFMLKRMIPPVDREFFLSIKRFFLRILIINGIRFGGFYFFFSSELTRFLQVVFENLF